MDSSRIPDAHDTHSPNAAILVTGGSGSIGRHLVKLLSSREKTVVSMYHHRLPEPMANVYPVCSDMGSAELIAAPLRGVDTVVHLAWDGTLVGPKSGVNPAREFSHNPSRNIRTLRNLITAVERAKTPRLVFLSALGASRQSDVPFLQEKYLAEFLVLNSKIPEKIILRSSVVYSSEMESDRFLRSITNVMRWPWMYPVPHAKDVIHPLHIDDLANTLAALVDHPMPEPSAIVELMGEQGYVVADLFRMIHQKTGMGSKLAIKGTVGQSLVSLFERDQQRSGSTPKLRDFLALGRNQNDQIKRENPLEDALPKAFRKIEDSVRLPH